jgi:hypothetical protein
MALWLEEWWQLVHGQCAHEPIPDEVALLVEVAPLVGFAVVRGRGHAHAHDHGRDGQEHWHQAA